MIIVIRAVLLKNNKYEKKWKIINKNYMKI